MRGDEEGGVVQIPWLPLAFAGLVAALTALHVADLWDGLPERFASHFGPSGRPDAFMPRGTFMTLMGAVGGGTVLLLCVLPQLLRFVPTRLINLPNRDYWLAPERRDRSLARLGNLLGWLGAATGVLFAGVMELAIRANLAQTGLDMGAFGIAMALYVATVIGVLVALVWQFRLPLDA
jgi:uncharacterized membrane protein